MMNGYHLFKDLMDHIEEPSDGVRSLTLYDENDAKVILIAFARGSRFSEHTTPDSVQIHVLEGEAVFTVRDDVVKAAQGALLYIPAGTPHGVEAQKPMRLLATFLKRAEI